MFDKPKWKAHMSDEIDRVYDLLQQRTRDWLRENGPRANGPMVQEAGRALFREVVGPHIKSIAT